MNKKVFIFPFDNSTNQFINIVKDSIKDAGFILTGSKKDFFQTDYYILNWYNVWGLSSLSELLKRLIKLSICKLFHKKIIYVVHNKKSHSNYSKEKLKNIYSTIIVKKLIKQSYKILIMCDETKESLKAYNKKISNYYDKIIKVPHPNYIGYYKDSVEIKKENDNIINFLFIGQIKQYKNIDLLIDCFNSIENDNIRLEIAGKCNNEDYKKYLLSKIVDDKIKINFNFINDDEMINLISKNDILILPYSLESSLNSGTIILAFTNKKTVISPYIGTLKEYKDSSFFYHYDYRSSEEHKQQLTLTINKVITDFNKNNNVLKEKGEIAYNIVKNENSKELLISTFKEIFI